VKWLIDEMLPPTTADELSLRGHDAIAVVAGLAGATDPDLFQRAVNDHRVFVTENFADFAALVEQAASRGESAAPVVFVRKSSFPAGPGLAFPLAEHLDAWADDHPDPYRGLHWP